MRVWNYVRQGLLVVLLLCAGGYYLYARTPCHIPIQYSVGTLDPRFKLSDAEFRSAIEEAAQVWEDAAGVNLFDYSVKGGLPISLIYDSRQATTEQTNQIKQGIDQTSDSADAIKAQYDSAEAKYRTAKAAYESALANYQTKLDAYNASIDYWNSHGGAPSAEYRALQAQKAELERQQSSIESQRLQVNAYAQQSNALGARYNSLANQVNAAVKTVNQTAGREFEEGLYTQSALGSKIDVFEFGDHAKLVRVLAHELGHALGLEHNTNPDSIMYETNQSTNDKPTAEDLADLKAVCKL